MRWLQGAINSSTIPIVCEVQPLLNSSGANDCTFSHLVGGVKKDSQMAQKLLCMNVVTH